VASFESAGFRVADAPDRDTATTLVDEFRPDAVIIDLRLPAGVEGYDVARTVRSRSEAGVIFLTALDGLEDRLKAFDLGADDYVPKPFSMPELLARTKAVLRRSGKQGPGRIAVRDLVIEIEKARVFRAEGEVSLTGTEFRLLLALARAGGEPVTKVQLLAEVWQFDAYDVNLVEVHVSALRRKLEALGPRLIFTERGRGYVLK
jgi:DNA-binding response OmpR family regulator